MKHIEPSGLGIGEMTLEEFLERLRETKCTWKVCSDGAIRVRGSGEWCPITAIAGAPSATTGKYRFYGRELGLSEQTITDIAEAADGPAVKGIVWKSAIRTALLNACGLTEGV